jgi:hypothetical protein
MILFQRLAVILIIMWWCWIKASQYNDSTLWVFGILAGLIDYLAYESGKQMGVFMVITLNTVDRERIIKQYDASKNNNKGDDNDEIL